MGELVSAALATEIVFGAVITVLSRLIFADSKPYQGTTTVRTNECFHFLPLKVDL